VCSSDLTARPTGDPCGADAPVRQPGEMTSAENSGQIHPKSLVLLRCCRSGLNRVEHLIGRRPWIDAPLEHRRSQLVPTFAGADIAGAFT